MLKASRTERYYFAGTVLDGEAIIIVNLQCDIVRIAADVAEKLRSISFNFCFQFVTIGGDTIGKQLMECCTDFNFFHCEIQICIRCAGFPNFFFKACQGYLRPLCEHRDHYHKIWRGNHQNMGKPFPV